MKILLVYYHPVIWSIADTFSKLGHKVSIAVNPNIKDNYGTGKDIIKKQSKQYTVYPLQVGLNMIKQKHFQLVGCDGVFDGDVLVMDMCKQSSVPHFCIQGYPNVFDEPSDNILSLGWFTPFIQYHQKFPSEGHKKQQDWNDIARFGCSRTKNICTFYPGVKNRTDPCYSYGKNFISLIQGYKKHNLSCSEVFEQVKEKIKNNNLSAENLEGQSFLEVRRRMTHARGLLQLKWADQPGMAVLEAMSAAKGVYTMKSFVLASNNHDILIDGYNAVVADTVEELVDEMKNPDLPMQLGKNSLRHYEIITSFERQKKKLGLFIERCLS